MKKLAALILFLALPAMAQSLAIPQTMGQVPKTATATLSSHERLMVNLPVCVDCGLRWTVKTSGYTSTTSIIAVPTNMIETNMTWMMGGSYPLQTITFAPMSAGTHEIELILARPGGQLFQTLEITATVQP